MQIQVAERRLDPGSNPAWGMEKLHTNSSRRNYPTTLDVYSLHIAGHHVKC